MNVYDFDGTVYKGDSSVDFFLFCIKRHPSCVLSIPPFFTRATAYKIGRCGKEGMKEAFFSFLPRVPQIENELNMFWDSHFCKISKWYLNAHSKDDVIISASPHFLLEEICARLQVGTLIATKVDRRSGFLLSPNCRGEEKVKRFNKALPNAHIENFYSDSRVDLPMARLADRAWLVEGETVRTWNIKP